MSERKISTVMIACGWCGMEKEVRWRGGTTARFCSKSCSSFKRFQSQEERLKLQGPRKPFVEKTCENCGKMFFLRSRGRLSEERRFCSVSCVGQFCMRNPERVELAVQSMRKAGNGDRTQARIGASKHMRENNPMCDPVIREKVSASLSGRTFLARGGNGKTTVPQEMLARELGWEMEVVILTATVQGMFLSLPNCFKVDIGSLELKVAIEVDGRSHQMRKWKFLDRRKTEILNALGWSVLRFSNKRVMEDLEAVVREVNSFIMLR